MAEVMEFSTKYGFLMVTLCIFAGFMVWIVVRNNTTNENQEYKPKIWSYLFVWPLLLTRKEGDKTVQRGFSRREWIGWLIFVLIALLAILFTPTKK